MKKQDLWKVIITIVILIVAFSLIMIFFYKKLNKNVEINSFEECAAAGNPVGESYPRQCWTSGGKHFIEEITWKNDQVFLMQNSETGEFACFGCGKTRCIDPIPLMKLVEETIEGYCNEDFEIVTEENIK